MESDAQDLTSQLDAEDRASVEAILVRLPIEDYARSLDHLLRGWSWLVEEIENGYNDNIFEYLNDVSVRAILHRVLAGVPQPTRERLARVLQPFDERFLVATVPIDRYLGAGVVHLDDPPYLETRPDAVGEWWYTRIPRRPGEELAPELKRFST